MKWAWGGEKRKRKEKTLRKGDTPLFLMLGQNRKFVPLWRRKPSWWIRREIDGEKKKNEKKGKKVHDVWDLGEPQYIPGQRRGGQSSPQRGWGKRAWKRQGEPTQTSNLSIVRRSKHE